MDNKEIMTQTETKSIIPWKQRQIHTNKQPCRKVLLIIDSLLMLMLRFICLTIYTITIVNIHIRFRSERKTIPTVQSVSSWIFLNSKHTKISVFALNHSWIWQNKRPIVAPKKLTRTNSLKRDQFHSSAHKKG